MNVYASNDRGITWVLTDLTVDTWASDADPWAWLIVLAGEST